MGVRHNFHTVVLGGDPALTLSQLTNAAHEPQVSKTNPDTGGPYVEVRFIESVIDQLSFSTEAIGQVLDNLALLGATCIGSGEDFTTIDLFGRALAACGADQTASGSVHRRTRGDSARLVVTEISAQANQSATATVMGYLLSADGDAVAQVTVHNVALPTGGVVNEAFRTHALRLAGHTFDADKLTSVSLSTGVQITPELGTKTRPTVTTIVKSDPTLTVETQDTTVEGVFGEGLLATHANTSWELAKRNPTNGGIVAAATAEHARITVAGHCHCENTSGSGSQVATSRVVCHATGVAGTPPLVATVGVALAL